MIKSLCLLTSSGFRRPVRSAAKKWPLDRRSGNSETQLHSQNLAYAATQHNVKIGNKSYLSRKIVQCTIISFASQYGPAGALAGQQFAVRRHRYRWRQAALPIEDQIVNNRGDDGDPQQKMAIYVVSV
jgi:hypothetical protein